MQVSGKPSIRTPTRRNSLIIIIRSLPPSNQKLSIGRTGRRLIINGNLTYTTTGILTKAHRRPGRIDSIQFNIVGIEFYALDINPHLKRANDTSRLIHSKRPRTYIQITETCPFIPLSVILNQTEFSSTGRSYTVRIRKKLKIALRVFLVNTRHVDHFLRNYVKIFHKVRPLKLQAQRAPELNVRGISGRHTHRGTANG